MTIRKFFGYLLAGLIGSALLFQAAFADEGSDRRLDTITVYKSPACSCCGKWVQHLQDNGFTVEAVDRQDMNSVKSEAGIPRRLASCHTAIIDGYVIEGHVPASDIRRLLNERPDVVGLAVPGMPMGSPGMEGPRSDHYDVQTFTGTGKTSIFSQY